VTAYKFTVTTTVAAVANDELWYEFATADGIGNMYANDLGMGAAAVEVDCTEEVTENNISAIRI